MATRRVKRRSLIIFDNRRFRNPLVGVFRCVCPSRPCPDFDNLIHRGTTYLPLKTRRFQTIDPHRGFFVSSGLIIDIITSELQTFKFRFYLFLYKIPYQGRVNGSFWNWINHRFLRTTVIKLWMIILHIFLFHFRKRSCDEIL